MSGPLCRTCLFSGLEPATEADAWGGQGGRFIRACALGRRPAAQPRGCASWARDPGEQAFTMDTFAHAVRQAREARV